MFKYHSVPVAQTRSTSLGAASVLLAVILAACGQPGTSQADTPAAPPLLAGGSAQAPGSAKLPGKTRVLTSFAGGTLTHLSAGGTLTFERPMVLPVRAAGVGAEQIDDVTELNPGDILVTAPTTTAPYGFMRKVEKVEGSNGAIVVTTSPATLNDAIKGSGLPAGNYKMTKAIQTDEVIAESVVGEDGELVAQGLPAFGNEHTEAGFYSLPLPQQELKSQSLGNVDVGSGKQCVKIKIAPKTDIYSKNSTAKACFTLSLTALLDSTIGFGFGGFFGLDSTLGPYLNTFSAKIIGTASGSVDLTVTSSVQALKVKRELAKVTYLPIVLEIGPVPVVIIPVYTVSLGMDGSTTGTFTASYAGTAYGSIGVEYDHTNGWHGTGSEKGLYKSDVASLGNPKIAVNFKNSFDNSIALFLDGVAGPEFKLSTYINYSGSSNGLFKTNKVVGGLKATASIKSVFFNTPLTYEYTFFDREQNLSPY